MTRIHQIAKMWVDPAYEVELIIQELLFSSSLYKRVAKYPRKDANFEALLFYVATLYMQQSFSTIQK